MKATTWDIDPKRTTDKLNYLIWEYINGPKCETYREILRLHYIHGKTYEQVAEAVGMSKDQVGRVIRKYGDKLLRML